MQDSLLCHDKYVRITMAVWSWAESRSYVTRSFYLCPPSTMQLMVKLLACCFTSDNQLPMTDRPSQGPYVTYPRGLMMFRPNHSIMLLSQNDAHYTQICANMMVIMKKQWATDTTGFHKMFPLEQFCLSPTSLISFPSSMPPFSDLIISRLAYSTVIDLDWISFIHHRVCFIQMILYCNTFHNATKELQILKPLLCWNPVLTMNLSTKICIPWHSSWLLGDLIGKDKNPFCLWIDMNIHHKSSSVSEKMC